MVMKFGGISVADEEARLLAVSHIIREVKAGFKVLAVVSAMGRLGSAYATDSLAGLVTKKITPREGDRLLSCGEIISSIVMSDLVRSEGVRSVSLAPCELGILTDGAHGDANVLLVDTLDLAGKFAEHDVLIAPGFVGLSEAGFITTLGRGGSDTSAIALGASLGADYVDIYSDVVGVMTTDPKIDPNATLISEMAYDKLIEMAEGGARVIHLKAIKLAKDCKVNLRFRSTFTDFIGTVVQGGEEE